MNTFASVYRRALALLAVLLLPGLAAAANYTASTASGLASAITSVNAGSGGGDTITLTGNITLASVLPSLTKDVIIEGGNFTLSGNNLYRIFNVAVGETQISNLTLADGKNAGAKGGNGGIGSPSSSTSSYSGGGGAGAGWTTTGGTNGANASGHTRGTGSNGGGTGGHGSYYRSGASLPNNPQDGVSGAFGAGGGGGGGSGNWYGYVNGESGGSGGSGGGRAGNGGRGGYDYNTNKEYAGGGGGGGGSMGAGGAIFVNSAGSVRLTNVAFSGNAATGGAGGSGGAATAGLGGWGGNGGGGGSGFGGAIFVMDGGRVSFSGSEVFTANTGTGGSGGSGGSGDRGAGVAGGTGFSASDLYLYSGEIEVRDARVDFGATAFGFNQASLTVPSITKTGGGNAGAGLAGHQFLF